MRQLVGYELKKILMKKSAIVTFFILFVLNTVFVGISGSLGNTYVEGEFYETHIERNRIDRANGLEMSGRKMDDTLIAEMKEAYQKVDRSTTDYKWTDTYKNKVRKYDDIENRFKMWGLNSNILDESVSEEFEGETIGERLYLARELIQQQTYKELFLTEEEIAYWEEKDETVEKPFIYQYAAGYESLIGMQGIYMICMLTTFFAAVVMVTVFAEEHTKKTDQLILCTRFGRSKEYFAKIIAGSLVSFGVTLLFLVVAIAGKFYSYGWEGFGASLQVGLAYWYPYKISMGEASLILAGLLLLASVLLAVFAMLLAELLRNSIGAMAIIVGLFFASRLVVFPQSWRVISQAWNYMPLNIVKVDEGFVDLRTVDIFGVHLTSWQFVPVLYLLLIIFLVMAGKSLYKNYQISGR